MKLLDLLKAVGLSEKEIFSNFALKQIRINGIVCTALDKDIKVVSDNIGFTLLDEFLFELSSTSIYNDVKEAARKARYSDDYYCSIQELSVESKRFKEFMSGFVCISVGKLKQFVFILK